MGEFKKLMASDKLVIIDFKADWCPPCLQIDAQFKSTADDYPDIIFATLDVDDKRVAALSVKENIKSMPTFIVYEKGKQVDKVIGANIDKVKASLDKLRDRKNLQAKDH